VAVFLLAAAKLDRTDGHPHNDSSMTANRYFFGFFFTGPGGHG
jgi:hypothetical protein